MSHAVKIACSHAIEEDMTVQLRLDMPDINKI
jgi:hypothetical protein